MSYKLQATNYKYGKAYVSYVPMCFKLNYELRITNHESRIPNPSA